MEDKQVKEKVVFSNLRYYFLLMQTYELMEEIAHLIPASGIYRESRKIKVNRYLSKSGWVLNKFEGKEEDIKPHEECESYVSPAVKEWEKLDEILCKLNDITVTVKKVYRKINNCTEEKILNYVEYNGLKFAYAGKPSDLKAVEDFLKMQSVSMNERILGLERTNIILDPEATAHVFHQFMSFLKGDNSRIKLGERISREITVYDDPLSESLIGFSTFDDEGVKTRKKEIIGDGTILEYLGTLTTKNGNPGNARGILPIPDYFNLIIKPKDWGFQELIQDTKNGLLVLGVKKSEIVKNSIRIFPRNSMLIGYGGAVVREIAIPLQELVTIDAISKEVKSVYIDDEHGGISPFIRLKARPIVY
ncbi:metallopeptidase TldD-related protein [Acidianus sp. HS-5]|uniref:metallopeptidase TldD-related protein n=1 Tax=Acidianus sp. HS-5 TaxID=2886040 RepID=UPI001F42D8A4|nr:metallopeptidase TldD-related protein [Acidianus sp. HS-5]BDC19433.1 hypothetical protein HS5_23230 [Acidianus sp. HS-5]